MATRDDQSAIEIASPFKLKSLPLSTTVVFGNLVFVSGMTGCDPETGEMARGDVAAQTMRTMESIRRELELVGTSLDNVLKTTVFLVEMSLFEQMNEAYSMFFSADPPARSCVGVMSLPDKQALVEIEAIAGREPE